jgi:hypothetical protein
MILGGNGEIRLLGRDDCEIPDPNYANEPELVVPARQFQMAIPKMPVFPRSPEALRRN